MLALECCPFCANEQVATIEIDADSWMVECLACHTTGPVLPSESAARLHWNQRQGYQGGEPSVRARLVG